MNQGKYIFSQICDFLPKNQFDWFVKKYQGNKYVKKFTCWNHLLVMIFAQLTHRESLRDLIATLNAHKTKFNRLGFGTSVTRSNLSKANEQREAKIFEDMAYHMVKTARDLRIGLVDKDFFYEGNVYAFDSTTISLCLNVFWWSKLHHDKGGVKMHTLYDVKTDIPSFFLITNADLHDSKVMNEIPYEPGALYIFDRAYMDTEQLAIINTIKAFFVVREKRRMSYTVIEDKQYNNPITGVMADQTIQFSGYKTRKQYSSPMRRITFYDMEGNRTFVFYTNNSILSAEDIALAYKYRWRVELFFYDKNNIMRSEWKSIIEDQNFRRMLLRSTSHNDNYFFRPLSQSLRFLLFSQDLSASRLGVRSVYAFSNASRFALESARA